LRVFSSRRGSSFAPSRPECSLKGPSLGDGRPHRSIEGTPLRAKTHNALSDNVFERSPVSELSPGC